MTAAARALTAGTLALLAGCAQRTATRAPGTVGALDYSPADRMRVMLPPAGGHGDAPSRLVAARVVEVLQRTHGDVALVPTANEREALAATQQAGAKYLVVPVILEWSDTHAPPVTADRVRVRLEMRDARDGAVASAITFEAVSSLFTVIDQPPDALLDQSFDRSVGLLITTGTPARTESGAAPPGAAAPLPPREQRYPRQ